MKKIFAAPILLVILAVWFTPEIGLYHLSHSGLPMYYTISMIAISVIQMALMVYSVFKNREYVRLLKLTEKKNEPTDMNVNKSLFEAIFKDSVSWQVEYQRLGIMVGAGIVICAILLGKLGVLVSDAYSIRVHIIMAKAVFLIIFIWKNDNKRLRISEKIKSSNLVTN